MLKKQKSQIDSFSVVDRENDGDIIFFLLRHKTTAVNGVIVGRISPKDDRIVEISDSVPLFHSNLAFLPPLAISLIMIRCSINEPLKVMISGAPASGKGTQCELIVNKLHPKVLASGAATMDVVVLAVILLAMADHSSGTWCECREGLSEAMLQKTLDYACGAGADCVPIHQNRPCFDPNTVRCPSVSSQHS